MAAKIDHLSDTFRYLAQLSSAARNSSQPMLFLTGISIGSLAFLLNKFVTMSLFGRLRLAQKKSVLRPVRK
jgi:hypothetical protein